MVDVDIFLKFDGSIDSLTVKIAEVLGASLSAREDTDCEERHLMYAPPIVVERHGFVDDHELKVEDHPWMVWFPDSGLDTEETGRALFEKLKPLDLPMLLIRDVEEVLASYEPK